MIYVHYEKPIKVRIVDLPHSHGYISSTDEVCVKIDEDQSFSFTFGLLFQHHYDYIVTPCELTVKVRPIKNFFQHKQKLSKKEIE